MGVVFLSGATEANNLAIKGVGLVGPGRHVVTSVVEHASILSPCRDLVTAGLEVTSVGVDREGRVSPDDVRRALQARHVPRRPGRRPTATPEPCSRGEPSGR